MFISISLINHIELKNIVQKTLSIGIRKIHYVLSAYLINLFLLGTSIILLYYFIEKNSFILLLSIMVGFRGKTAITASLGLSQVGEFAFIILKPSNEGTELNLG